jgi:hypothetical protein
VVAFVPIGDPGGVHRAGGKDVLDTGFVKPM